MNQNHTTGSSHFASGRVGMVWGSVVLHLAACIGLLLCAAGTELASDTAARRAWLAAHSARWTINWLLWMASSISLLAVCWVWTAALLPHLSRSRKTAARFACGVIGLGVCFDVSGESVALVLMTQTSLTTSEFLRAARLYQWLSPAIANGLYCVAGSVLSVLSWRANWLGKVASAVGLTMWGVGLALTAATIIEHRIAMTAAGGGVMVLFLLWAALLACKLSRS